MFSQQGLIRGDKLHTSAKIEEETGWKIAKYADRINFWSE